MGGFNPCCCWSLKDGCVTVGIWSLVSESNTTSSTLFLSHWLCARSEAAITSFPAAVLISPFVLLLGVRMKLEVGGRWRKKCRSDRGVEGVLDGSVGTVRVAERDALELQVEPAGGSESTVPGLLPLHQHLRIRRSVPARGSVLLSPRLERRSKTRALPILLPPKLLALLQFFRFGKLTTATQTLLVSLLGRDKSKSQWL